MTLIIMPSPAFVTPLPPHTTGHNHCWLSSLSCQLRGISALGKFGSKKGGGVHSTMPAHVHHQMRRKRFGRWSLLCLRVPRICPRPGNVACYVRLESLLHCLFPPCSGLKSGTGTWASPDPRSLSHSNPRSSRLDHPSPSRTRLLFTSSLPHSARSPPCRVSGRRGGGGEATPRHMWYLIDISHQTDHLNRSAGLQIYRGWEHGCRQVLPPPPICRAEIQREACHDGTHFFWDLGV